MIIQIVSVERVAFDTMGQMWGTLIINCATALCSLVGMAGVCIHEKIAIAVVGSFFFVCLLFMLDS